MNGYFDTRGKAKRMCVPNIFVVESEGRVVNVGSKAIRTTIVRAG